MAPTHLLSVLYYNKLCGGRGRADKELHKETLECPFVLKDSLAAVIFHPVPCWGKKGEIVIAPFPSSCPPVLLTPLITVGGTLYVYF